MEHLACRRFDGDKPVSAIRDDVAPTFVPRFASLANVEYATLLVVDSQVACRYRASRLTCFQAHSRRGQRLVNYRRCSALQSSHSRQPPQQSAQPTYTQQQRRAVHEAPHHNQPSTTPADHPTGRPRNQLEAMPPFPPAQAPGSQSFYDSAIRHPVFFTQNLKKPPFPIPQIASQGWSPVANGYIMEQQRVLNKDPKTKL